MKLLKYLPSFLRPKPVPVVIPSIENIQVVAPERPETPFSKLDDHLAELIATETEAEAAHTLAVMRLNDYMQTLEDRAKTHLASVQALYAEKQPVRVNIEKAT